MKTEKYYLFIAIVIGILCVPTLGEVEIIPPGTLLGQAEPALKGIRQLYIVVHSPTNVAPVSGISFREIENTVKEKIEEAGITIAESDVNKLEPNSVGARLAKRIDPANVKNLRFMDARTPELQVEIDTLHVKDSNQVVFYVKTSLARLVYLGKDNQFGFKTDVWRSEAVMRAVLAEGMPAAVTSTVLEQVEAFIHAYMAANPPGKQDSDANDIGNAAEDQLKPVAESTPAEYKYVASKNGKVFHKPDCIWVQRIKPENLVGYNSRDEAINAGKRPCKQCKP
jgi:hypothetical protein